MAIKVTGQFQPAGSFAIVDGRDVSGAITGSTVSASTMIVGSMDVIGNLTAQQYIISSSVTNITTQAISGSTMFGNSSDDTHQMTGSLYIKGGLTVENLGTLTNRDDSGTLDYGDAFS